MFRLGDHLLWVATGKTMSKVRHRPQEQDPRLRTLSSREKYTCLYCDGDGVVTQSDGVAACTNCGGNGYVTSKMHKELDRIYETQRKAIDNGQKE